MKLGKNKIKSPLRVFYILFIPFRVLLYLRRTIAIHFSPVVSSLCSHLSLSPSMAAVTLLALGNSAPDVFSSLSGQPRTGLGAILSAGAFVIGFVAINAALFSVDPAPFIRDVLFYLTSALFLFYVYLSGELYLWQAVGFVGFYLFFVGLVFWMDLGGRKDSNETRFGTVRQSLEISDCEIGDLKLQRKSDSEDRPDLGIRRVFEKL